MDHRGKRYPNQGRCPVSAMIRLPGRRRFWVILFVTAIIFLAYSAVGESGFIRLHGMVKQRDELGLRVQALKQSNAELSERIRLLRDDPDTIEHLARTELGMVRDGETVYILSERKEDKTE